MIRRLDCVLEGTKQRVLTRAEELAGKTSTAPYLRVAGHEFYNVAPFDFAKLTGDPDNLWINLREYIGGFSPLAREVIEKFRFDEHIRRLTEAGLISWSRGFPDIDLHPEVVDNTAMSYMNEELIRRLSERSNEIAKEHSRRARPSA